MSVNKLILVGKIKEDAKVNEKSGEQGDVTIKVITEKDGSDKNKELPDIHSIVFTGKLKDVVQKYAKKDLEIYVEGELHYHHYVDSTLGEKKSAYIKGKSFEVFSKE